MLSNWDVLQDFKVEIDHFHQFCSWLWTLYLEILWCLDVFARFQTGVWSLSSYLLTISDLPNNLATLKFWAILMYWPDFKVERVRNHYHQICWLFWTSQTTLNLEIWRCLDAFARFHSGVWSLSSDLLTILDLPNNLFTLNFWNVLMHLPDLKVEFDHYHQRRGFLDAVFFHFWVLLLLLVRQGRHQSGMEWKWAKSILQKSKGNSLAHMLLVPPYKERGGRVWASFSWRRCASPLRIYHIQAAIFPKVLSL